MRAHNETAKEYLHKFIKPMRRELGFTQEHMAETLRMSSRSYGAAERGEDGLSAATLLFFLALLPDAEILGIVRGFPQEIQRREKEMEKEGHQVA